MTYPVQGFAGGSSCSSQGRGELRAQPTTVRRQELARSRDPHPENGALAGGGDQVDLAVVGGGERGDDGQAEAGSATVLAAAGGVDPVEAFEHPGGLLRGQARTVVGHLDDALALDGTDADPYRGARRGVLDGVADQVGDH